MNKRSLNANFNKLEIVPKNLILTPFVTVRSESWNIDKIYTYMIYQTIRFIIIILGLIFHMELLYM